MQRTSIGDTHRVNTFTCYLTLKLMTLVTAKSWK